MFLAISQEGICVSNVSSGGKFKLFKGDGVDNDIITFSGTKYNVVKYVAGAGNYTICGLTAEDTLFIAGDTFTATVKANDVIVTVGSNFLKVIGAAGILIVGRRADEGDADVHAICTTSADESDTATVGCTYDEGIITWKQALDYALEATKPLKAELDKLASSKK